MASTSSIRRTRLTAVLGVGAVTLAACGSGGSSESSGGAGGTEGAGAGDCSWSPERGVTMVVPFDPGGGSDLFGRAVAAGLEEVRPDLNISTENRPGGSGTIGYTYFYEQSGDPHFLLGAENAMVSLPLQHEELPYDATSWTPLGMVVEDTIFLIGSADAGWQDFEGFLAAAREADSAGDPLAIAQPTAESVEAMPLQTVLEKEGITVEFVTFDGTAGSIPALLAGDIDGILANPSEVEGQVEAGDFAPVVANTKNSLEIEPYQGIPSLADLGYEPRGAFSQFRGVLAPPDIPDCAQQYWTEALKEWTETEAYQEYVESNVVAPNQIWGDEWLTYLDDVEKGYQEVYETTGG